MWFGLGIAALVLVLDQVTKSLVLYGVFGLPFPAPIDVWRTPLEITGFFNLVLVWNTGVSFGLFANDADTMRWLLSAVALAISAVLVVWLRRADSGLLAAALGMVIGGALGNIVDRVLYGAVADFLDLHLMGYHWPAFNVADGAIVVGVAALLLDSFRSRSEERGRKRGYHDGDKDR